MENTQVDGFNIIGITVRTENNNGKGLIDIGGLWARFMTENILVQIPNKIDNTIYSIYTDYESDYTGLYTTILGCRVSNLDNIPSGFVGRNFASGKYNKYVAKGNILTGIVADAWKNIWSLEIDRSYIYDFEVYGANAQNPLDAEVEIYIGVK